MSFFVSRPSMWAHWLEDVRNLSLHPLPSAQFSISACHPELLIPPTSLLRVKFIKECQKGRKGSGGKGRRDAVRSNALSEKQHFGEYSACVSYQRRTTVLCACFNDCFYCVNYTGDIKYLMLNFSLAMDYLTFVADKITASPWVLNRDVLGINVDW